MKILHKICFVLLMTTFPSVYGGDYLDVGCFDVDGCRVQAEQGVAKSQYNLGNKYYNGEGVVQDYKEAVKWFRKSAEQGDSLAQSYLGWMYGKGEGVIQDYKEAVKWYRKSAEQGDSLAQYNLGYMHAQGQGVPQDYVMAHVYWNIASVSGYENAITNRGVIEESMTPSQIAEAQKLAREWMQKHQ